MFNMKQGLIIMCFRTMMLVSSISLMPSKAFAGFTVDMSNPSLIPASGGTAGCNFVTGDISASCIPDYIRYLLQIIFMFIGAFFLLMIIIAGYQIAIGSAIGDKEAGKNRLKMAIVGFIISALSFFIVDFFIAVLQ